MKNLDVDLNDTGEFRSYLWFFLGIPLSAIYVAVHTWVFVFGYVDGALYMKIAYGLTMAFTLWGHFIYNSYIIVFYLSLCAKFKALNEYFR